jgi:NAD-dependent dihydropyrimidine dehydrogenase PreA subunit
MTYVITSACIDSKDKACVEECPVDSIYEGGRMLYINPDECVDCGACEPVCPTDAIRHEDEVPQDQKVFIKINKDFFKDIGNPGGSIGTNFLDMDHPDVINFKGNK